MLITRLVFFIFLKNLGNLYIKSYMIPRRGGYVNRYWIRAKNLRGGIEPKQVLMYIYVDNVNFIHE